MTLIVNLFGAPGSGKSTGASYLFSQLKLRGINCELVTEYAKDLAWEKRLHPHPSDPWYITVSQYHRQWRVNGQVDVIITDSPIVMGIPYGDGSNEFYNTSWYLFNKFKNVNYFIERAKPYKKQGRYCDEYTANRLGESIFEEIKDLRPKVYKGNEDGYNRILTEILNTGNAEGRINVKRNER